LDKRPDIPLTLSDELKGQEFHYLVQMIKNELSRRYADNKDEVGEESGFTDALT
jgi:hypothetical protein